MLVPLKHVDIELDYLDKTISNDYVSDGHLRVTLCGYCKF